MIEERIISILRDRSQTLATAESCTGGLVAHCLTNVPGASAVFLAGVVSYSNESKIKHLGVSPQLLKEKGAVSAEIASAMAEGILTETGATFGVATTGIAGPGGGAEEQPVGTLFLAIAEQGKPTTVWREMMMEERVVFKKRATEVLLEHLLRRLTA